MSVAVAVVILLLALPLPYAIDGAPRLWRAPVTLLLVVANLAITLSHVTLHGFSQPYALYDKYGETPADLWSFTLLTYTFVHISLAHVLWNMLFLYLFGPIVERRIGSVKFALFYFAGGAAAGLLNGIMVDKFAPISSDAYIPLVGASGAVSAVLGIFAAFASHRNLQLFWPAGAIFGRGWRVLEIPSGLLVGIWLAQSIYGAVVNVRADSSNIAYYAHLGGLLFGFVCGLLGRLNQPVESPAEQDVAKTTAPGGAEFAHLLERAVTERDLERAKALYAKCVSMKVPLNAQLQQRFRDLTDERGDADQAKASGV